MSFSLRSIVPGMGLNLKILLTLSLILIGFAVACGITFNMIQRKELKSHLDQLGELMVTMLSGSLQSGLYFEDLTAIDQAVKTLVSLKLHKDLEAITVYDTNDRIFLRHILPETKIHPGFPRMVGLMAKALIAYHENPEQGKIWEDDNIIIFTRPVSVPASRQSSENLFFDTENKEQARTLIGFAHLYADP